MPEWLLDFLDTRFAVYHPLTGVCSEASYQDVLTQMTRVGLAWHSEWWPRLEAIWSALELIFDFYRP